MTTTVAKTIGTTGTFSTVQLWEDGAPTNLTTAEVSAATTFLVAAFTQGEALSFVGSGATGKLLDTDSTGAGTGTYVTYGITAGNPAASDVVTGGTSGATCVLTSGTPTDTGIIWQGQCQNQEFTNAITSVVVIGGSTTSASAYKELTTFAGASFRDNANVQTNPLRYDATVGCGLNCSATNTFAVDASEDNAHVSKLQITATGSGGRALRVVNLSAPGCFFDFLIMEGKYTASSASIGVLAANEPTTVRNCVIIQRNSAADHIVACNLVASNFYNCTIVAADDLVTAPTKIFISQSGSGIVQNCGLFAGDSTKALSTGTPPTYTTCYSDISGTAGVTQVTYSSQFQDVNDATRDFRLKAGADMLNTGTTDATNAANDIVGTARPQGSAYDVGCWETVVAAGKVPYFPTPQLGPCLAQ